MRGKKKIVVRSKDHHVEQVLDEALKESFPASDPVGIICDKLQADKSEKAPWDCYRKSTLAPKYLHNHITTNIHTWK